MRHLLTESSRKIARASGRINKIFGARYRWTILYSPRDYAYVYKYVVRNPARAGICDGVEDYYFSTFGQILKGTSDIPTCDRADELAHHVPREISERLRWLNQPTPKEAESLVGKGLRRFEFQFSTDNTHQKNLRLLKLHYGVEA